MSAKFTEGSVYKQLFSMMFASWVAMAASIAVGLVDMFFLSFLKQLDVLAAVGFAGSLMFIAGSLGIAFSVATGVLVSQKLGRDGREEAGRWFTGIVILSQLAAAFMVLVLLPNMPWFLTLLGAEPSVQPLSLSYLFIVFPTAPLSVLVMVASSALRAQALAKLSMVVALISAVVNIALDPLLIFTMGLGLEGAAWATAISRLVAVAVALYFLIGRLQFMRAVNWQAFKKMVPAINHIAMPTVLTNLFTPVGSLVVVKLVADYGTEAMAGQALISSFSPLLFSVYFSMTGAAGPMIGQNIGAKKPERVVQVFKAGLMVISFYTALLWAILSLAYPLLIELYHAKGLAAHLIKLYSQIQLPMFAGLGFLAMSNILFNNLGKPLWATWFNGLRATLGTFLFCGVGAWAFGLDGVVIGSSLTFAVFGVVALVVALRLFKRHYPGTHWH